MKKIFRSRVPPPLTSTQTNTLIRQTHLSTEDIEEWYERFNHCYPRGYLSYKEFLDYLQHLNNNNQKKNDNRSMKSILKQLFRILDINEDKQLNFEEFLFFNILINLGSIEDRLKLILNLYDQNKTKYLTREQLENVLLNMFDLLNIPKPINGLSQRIETILIRANFNNQNTKISWHTFSTAVLNDSSLFQLLISSNENTTTLHDDDDDFDYIITRF